MSPRALIFDFDGVLVDLEPLHMLAWQQVLAPLHLDFSKEDYDTRYLGLNDRDILAKCFQEANKHLSPKLTQELIFKKELKTREIFSKDIPLIDGVQEFLEEVYPKYPLSIVTGALSGEVYFVLDRLHWRHYFPIVISAADVQKGKPDPEGYLKAFEKIKGLKNWDPPLLKSDCLIFEDSQYGIEAAKRAGIPFIEVKGTLRSHLSIFQNGDPL